MVGWFYGLMVLAYDIRFVYYYDICTKTSAFERRGHGMSGGGVEKIQATKAEIEEISG